MRRRWAVLMALVFCPSLVSGEPDWLRRGRRLLDQPLTRASRDLKWIKGPRDFDQDGLGIAPVHSRIASLIHAQETLALRAVEFPINNQELTYRGYRKASFLPLFKIYNRSAVPDIARYYHVYELSKRGVVILSERAGVADQLSVHAVIRALTLLEVRYPELYRALYRSDAGLSKHGVEARYRDDSKRAGRPAPWVNLTERHVIILSSQPYFSAASVYWLGPKKVQAIKGRKVSVYRNLAVVRLNVGQMVDFEAKNIYRGLRSFAAFLMYLRDGLLETLVHEGMHNRLSADAHIDPLARAVKSWNKGVAGSRQQFNLEEAIVCHSSLLFFEELARRESGLHGDIFRYYRGLMFGETHRQRLTSMLANDKESKAIAKAFGSITCDQTGFIKVPGQLAKFLEKGGQ